MRRFAISVFLAAGIVLGACGDDDDPAGQDAIAADGTGDDDTGDGTDGDATNGDGAATESGSAVVELDGVTYDFTEASSCDASAPDSVFVSINEGPDQVSITSSDGVVLIRMTLEGNDWVDLGSPPEPQVDGTSVSWSGEMSSAGTRGQVDISVTC